VNKTEEKVISGLLELSVKIGGLKQEVESLRSENAYLRKLLDRAPPKGE
jgi:hypothetical protein